MGLYSILCISSVLVVSAYAGCSKNLVSDLTYKLSGYEIAFPCESTKNIYKNTGSYIPRHIIATRMQIWKDEAYVALPRYKHGVPFTLGKFSLKQKGCRPQIQPFPTCWAMQEEGNCDSLQNVVDISIDTQNQLWALDTGIVNTLQQPILRCCPKLVGFNLLTSMTVKIINLKPYVVPESRLQHVIVDYTKEGIAFAYIADGGSGAIIVINLVLGTGFRIVLPKAITDHCQKDVLYIQLARKPSGNVLYFSYLSSGRLFSIKADFLQKGLATGTVVDVGAKPQCTGLVLLGTDNGAALIFRYKGESDIYIWNTETHFKPDNFILVQKGDDCRLATQVVAGYKKLMWVIESNFPDFVLATDGSLGPNVAVHPLIKTYE
ncbi:unnamed protein product [Acanthoscelides obtectus]|uniref:Uncharacterized protein n=1 Tax=Acanthoscelides obtectus TaxID=200917 RepID=A0A9P0KBP0_ACAOB|nr:unnamed protein product [Acanthoscelides obtectus]CAK1635551.1 Protein yellow [Acanthoscelides obtectus]